jgi:hypothetical protein
MPSKLHCASCGRPDKRAPDDANPIKYEGQQWCSWCAKISKTSAGTIFIMQPSPGMMVGGPEDDPLIAWKDCYLMQPKRRILLEDAKSEIRRAWAMWEGDKSADNSMFVFFEWLTRHRPYFLTFRSKGDPWQKVHSWLVQYEREQQDSTAYKYFLNVEI